MYNTHTQTHKRNINQLQSGGRLAQKMCVVVVGGGMQKITHHNDRKIKQLEGEE